MTTASSDDLSRSFGYEPQLRRTLGSFQVFAISFASVSVIIGIFGTYDDVLQSSGPVGIWLFPVVAVGQILVALVYAQFAARIPLSGSSYQWASRLVGPKVGWMFGWIAVWNVAISPVTIDNALATQCLMPLLGLAPDETTGRVLTVALLVVQAAIVILSVRVVGWTNSLAVGVELAIVVLLGIALVVVVVLTGDGSTATLFTAGTAADAPGYFALGGGLMAAMIMGMSTLVGFEASTTMAEEARDPFRSVPRAVVGSVVAAAVLGMVFVVVLTLAIGDVARVTASGSPVATILGDRFGPAVERPLLLVIGFAFFAAALVAMAAASRIAFAMARDRRFPAHRLVARVHPRTRTPVPATLLVLVVGVVLMLVLPGAALLPLILAGAILMFIPYGMTIVLYLTVRTRLERREGAWSLGRWELPVAVAALVWVVVALVVAVSTSATAAPVLIVIGLVVVGAVYFAWMLRARRADLEEVPETVATG